MLTLADLYTALGQPITIPNAGAIHIREVVIDSRQVKLGDLFVALPGEAVDGHRFVADAVRRGAIAALVQQEVTDVNATPDALPVLIRVNNTLAALQQIAAWWRDQFNVRVIGVTGSIGKTTTKEMLGSILSRIAPTLVTRGNLNNDLGVPVMLLELRPEHQYAVMELGASHQGEIDYTSNLVQPQVAGIINIGTAHLGEFGGREGICRAKSEIYAHILPEGISVVPADDDFTVTIRENAQTHSILSFGHGGDVFATEVELHPQSAKFNLSSLLNTLFYH